MGHFDELEFCFRRTTVPAYDQLRIAVLSIFYTTSQPPFASDSGLLERSSTLPSRDLWPKRNFVGVIAMLLTAHTSRRVPLAQYSNVCLVDMSKTIFRSNQFRFPSSVQWTNSRVAFYLLFGNHSLTSYSTSSRTWITLQIFSVASTDDDECLQCYTSLLGGCFWPQECCHTPIRVNTFAMETAHNWWDRCKQHDRLRLAGVLRFLVPLLVGVEVMSETARPCERECHGRLQWWHSAKRLDQNCLAVVLWI